MSVYLEFVNFDEVFNQLSHPPVIINDISESTEADKEGLKDKIFTNYETDLMSNTPSCDCGAIVGAYNLNVICNNCNTPVTTAFENALEPILWIRSPTGVEKLINPIIWYMLRERFRISSFDIIRWICDTSYRPSVQLPKGLESFMDLQIPRGYNHFVHNFFQIIETMFAHKAFKTKNKDSGLLKLLHQKTDCIFSHYIPVPNKALLVIEKTNVGTFADRYITGAIDSIQTIASIDVTLTRHTVRAKENRTVKTLTGLSDFYNDYMKNHLSSKQGLYRQHVYGSRANFTFRAVVTSITDQHEYDEIHIPWPIAISFLRYHMINQLSYLREPIRKLFNVNGFTANAALDLLNAYAKVYHPLIDAIFNYLIEQTPRKGIYVTINRNPSLARGSIQFVRITKIKKDPSISTVSFSILIVTPMNAKYWLLNQ